jgi:hypothetical protein
LPKLRKIAEFFIFAALLALLVAVALMKLARGCGQFFP